jgi:hypothetical protein
VHAWAAWRVYKISSERGARDRDFLESVFQKLLLNFTWWVNRKDVNGENVFSGGFLGLDNIGVFDRSQVLPNGARLRQADGTAWMAFYCATMLSIALELPGFYKRAAWFINHRPDLAHNISFYEHGDSQRFLLAIPSRARLERVLSYMLDENEFLSPYGIRSLSKFHEKSPCVFIAHGAEHRVDYCAGESRTHLFGGNSNWRGPIWFPVNYLLIEALERYHHFYGDRLQVECPTGSGRMMNLQGVVNELGART